MNTRPDDAKLTRTAPSSCLPLSHLRWALTALIILLAGASGVYATAYYVDRDASGTTHDGRSWATAWTRFADIQWGSSGVGAGDTLFISGGTTSKSYYERLRVRASGTAAARLVITKGQTAGHNGKVIIDGEYQRSAGVHIEGDDYITVSHLDFKRTINGNDGSRGDLYVRSSNGITVDSCTMLSERAHGGVHINGYGTPCRDCVVRNCTITTPAASLSGQTDGVYSQYDIDSLFENNTIIISNQNPSPHCDAFQCFKSTSVTIRNNYCEQDNRKGANAQGIFLSNTAGTSWIYNNVCVGDYATSSLLKFRITDGSAGAVRIYNNTIVGGQYYLVYSDSADMVMKNNLFYATGVGIANIPVLRFGNDVRITNPSSINHNLIYSANSSDLVQYSGSARNWSEWQALGVDANGLNVAPQLTSDHRPQPNSPLIDAGADLRSVGVTTDLAGVTRPQLLRFDIGAYEHGSGTEPPPPLPTELPAPSNLTVTPTN